MPCVYLPGPAPAVTVANTAHGSPLTKGLQSLVGCLKLLSWFPQLCKIPLGQVQSSLKALTQKDTGSPRHSRPHHPSSPCCAGCAQIGPLKVHMHEIIQFVFHTFLVSFNNRPGRGPEFFNSRKLNLEFPYKNGFSRIQRFHCRKLYTAKITQFYSVFSPITNTVTRRFCQKR